MRIDRYNIVVVVRSLCNLGIVQSAYELPERDWFQICAEIYVTDTDGHMLISRGAKA